MATALEGLARVALHRGESARAEALGEEALALHRELGYKQGIAASLVGLGRARLARGEDRSVLDLVKQSLVISDAVNDRLGVVVALEGLAAAIAGTRPAPAARLLGAAEALRAAIGSPTPPADRPSHDATLAAIRGALGDAATAKAQAEGRGLSPAAAVALARELA